VLVKEPHHEALRGRTTQVHPTGREHPRPTEQRSEPHKTLKPPGRVQRLVRRVWSLLQPTRALFVR
jgi:hypothetical protein